MRQVDDHPGAGAPAERSTRRQHRLFGALVVVCAATAAGAVVFNGEQSAPVPETAREVLAAARAARAPVVVLRAGERNRDAVGLVAIVRPDQPARRTLAALRCERVHFAASRGICVQRGGGFAAGYRAAVFGTDLRVRGAVELAGTPSRARVSPDGHYGSVTQFVSGHSYAERGAFSTETTIVDLSDATKIADLEDFEVLRGGRIVTAEDANFWGVTFASRGDRFYATLATGGRTYLMQGSLAARRMRAIHRNVECPSLSPDQTRLAYKKRVGSGAKPWRLSVLDLATMRETPLAESRGVDDQAEWLDDANVVYGLDGAIWTARADGSGRPHRLYADASSPAVVRW